MKPALVEVGSLGSGGSLGPNGNAGYTLRQDLVDRGAAAKFLLPQIGS
jgi:hypothetical protein